MSTLVFSAGSSSLFALLLFVYWNKFCLSNKSKANTLLRNINKHNITNNQQRYHLQLAQNCETSKLVVLNHVSDLIVFFIAVCVKSGYCLECSPARNL